MRSNFIQSQIEGLKVGIAQPNLSLAQISAFKIPLPPLKIQQEIVAACEVVDEAVREAQLELERAAEAINALVENISAPLKKLSEVTSKIGSGATPRGGESAYKETGITLIRSQNIYDYGF
ncbi:MAG: restriction endonuclease subunit S [Moraxellaceae bacterium]|nr:restriction endonuclease subunit S [Moraxellaceae bacterium]